MRTFSCFKDEPKQTLEMSVWMRMVRTMYCGGLLLYMMSNVYTCILVEILCSLLSYLLF